MTFEQVLSIINTAGVTGLLLLFLWGSFKGWWVWGWLYREKVEESKKWEALAWKATDSAGRGVDATGEVVAAMRVLTNLERQVRGE